MSFWKRGFPLLVVLFLAWALVHFFLDRGIARAIEAAGTAANGARVDVGGVSTSFLRLSATITGLAVTDKEMPMTNALEIKKLRLNLAAKPLFWKKFIVEDAEILGVRTGTKRRFSGALPEEKKKAAETKEKGPSALAGAAQNVKEAYDPNKFLTTDRLESYKKAEEEKARLAALPEEWKTRLAGMDVQPLQKEAEAFYEKARGYKPSLNNLTEGKALLKEGQALKRRLDDAKARFNENKKALAAETARTKGALQEVNRLRQQDLERALSEIKSLGSAEGFARALLGPEAWAKIQSGVGWFNKIRRLVPAKGEAEAPPTRERGRGRDIVFPFKHRWPSFHLVTARLSGETPGEDSLGFEGTLTDVSSQASLVDRPTTLRVTGEKGNRRLALNGVFDFRTETPRQTLEMTYTGADLTGQRLGELGGPVAVAKGEGALRAKLAAAGGQIDGEVRLFANALELTFPPASDKLMAAAQRAVSQVRSADATVKVSGPVSAPRLSLRSSLDQELARAAGETAKAELDAARAKIQARIDSLVGERIKGLAGEGEKALGPAAGLLGQQEKSLQAIENKIKDALAKSSATGGGDKPLKDLKGLFKKK